MLLYVGSFSYTPRALLCGEFLLHAPCSVMWGVSLTLSVLFYVGSFSYMPRALLCGEFLLHAPCSFMWGVSLTRPMLFYVRSFSYTFLAFAAIDKNKNKKCKNTVSRVKSAYRASDQASVVITWLLCLGSGRMLSMWGIAVIGFSVGISPWQTQLVWNRLGTDSRQTEAQSRRDPCPCTSSLNVFSVLFLSLAFFSFYSCLVFRSNGFIFVATIML